MEINSIRVRMTLAFSGAIAVVLLLSGAVLMVYIRHDLIGDADAILGVIGRTVQRRLERDPHSDLQELAERQSRQYGEQVVITPSEHWLVRANEKWRTITVKVQADEGQLTLAMNWSLQAETLRTDYIAITLFSLVALLTSTVGAWALVGRTLSPIGKLSIQARESSESGHINQLAAPSNDSEIVELVSTLNAMLARLNETVAIRGRFYAAASHELRTPLQALSGHLDLAASRPRSEEEYRATIKEARTQTSRLINLTRDLLLLHQVETVQPPTAEPVCLPSVIARILQQFGEQIDATGVTFVNKLPAKLTVWGPPSHVEIVVRNLIENAIKYAADEKRVTIRQITTGSSHATDKDKVTELEIFNSASPFPDWEPDRTFEAFYRPDLSRTGATGGNGLGLAICRAICVQNGWHIDVSQAPGGVNAIVGFPDLPDNSS